MSQRIFVPSYRQGSYLAARLRGCRKNVHLFHLGPRVYCNIQVKAEVFMIDSYVSSEQFLRDTSLFKKCREQDLQELALNLRTDSYKTGDTILFQGMICHQLFFVKKGEVSVRSRVKGETRLLAQLGPGAYFGEISLIKKSAATATISALKDETFIGVLDHDFILKVLKRHPEAFAYMEEKIKERNKSREEAFKEKKKDPLEGKDEESIITTY